MRPLHRNSRLSPLHRRLHGGGNEASLDPPVEHFVRVLVVAISARVLETLLVFRTKRQVEAPPLGDAVPNVSSVEKHAAVDGLTLGHGDVLPSPERGLGLPQLPEEGPVVRCSQSPRVSAVEFGLHLAFAPTAVAQEEQEVLPLGFALTDQLPGLREVDQVDAFDDLVAKFGDARQRVEAEGHPVTIVVDALAIASAPHVPPVALYERVSPSTDGRHQGRELGRGKLQVVCGKCGGSVQD
mmetsp:Transcript_55364/g.154205  ORF Transcript_55364/g.154205 Transcript_55364/m.154205 type:complete len:240 (-) Transcript_55364:619-1338(-)